MSREEAKALRIALGPRMRWLFRLCERIDQLGIDPSDPIRLAAYEAYNALHALAVRAHYGSCDGGVGMSPRE